MAEGEASTTPKCFTNSVLSEVNLRKSSYANIENFIEKSVEGKWTVAFVRTIHGQISSKAKGIKQQIDQQTSPWLYENLQIKKLKGKMRNKICQGQRRPY